MTSQQLDLNARFVHWGEYDVMYARVAASGHRYAQLALGVLSSEGSIAGAAATSFLQSTVEATGRGFTEEDRVRVYQHMARGYVEKLSLQIGEAGSVHREINYREAWDLHTEAFEGLGYGRDAWTLNAVFEVIGNDNDRQQYWDSVLNAAGNPVSELLLARSTYSMMFHARMFGNEAQAAHASRWLNRIETLDNAISVGNAAVNVSSKELNSFSMASIPLSVPPCSPRNGTPIQRLPPCLHPLRHYHPCLYLRLHLHRSARPMAVKVVAGHGPDLAMSATPVTASAVGFAGATHVRFSLSTRW